MSNLCITWNKFTVHKKHDIDRDRPYLWVFGVLVDVNTLLSKDYVIRRPCGHENLGQKFKKGESRAVPRTLDIVQDVTPIPVLGAVAGVVVVAWENAMTRDKVIADAYDAAADAINKFIRDEAADAIQQLITQGLHAEIEVPSAAELDTLEGELKDKVRSTIKDGWSVFQMVPDHNIGSANCVLTLDGPRTQPLDFRFTKKTTDYELEGELKYT